ncbi:MAG: hypothetical protein ACTHJ5_15650 [Ilyomonas sp.]
MKTDFSENFNEINFRFHRNQDKRNGISYQVTFNDNGTQTVFTLNEVSEQTWMITSEILPEWIMETEEEFSERIKINEAAK